MIGYIYPECKTPADLAAVYRACADAIDPPQPVAELNPPRKWDVWKLELPRKWDVMIDLETWGTRPGCAIRSIGAVCFDPNTDELGAEFYANVRNQGESHGLTVDPKTFKWWGEPEQDLANAMLLTGQRSLGDVAQSFREWFYGVNGGNVWAHGAAFDQPIWDVASNAVGVAVPWHYRAVRDTRTLYALAEFEPATVPNEGTPHHALADARYQAICVQRAMAKLRSPWGPIRGLGRWG